MYTWLACSMLRAITCIADTGGCHKTSFTLRQNYFQALPVLPTQKASIDEKSVRELLCSVIFVKRSTISTKQLRKLKGNKTKSLMRAPSTTSPSENPVKCKTQRAISYHDERRYLRLHRPNYAMTSAILVLATLQG